MKPLLLGLVVLALLVFAGLPLGAMLLQALDPAALAALRDPINLRALGNTALLCLGVTLFSLAIGVPMGWLLGRTDLPGAAAWRVLLSLPYVVPPYIGAIAWTWLLNPTNGLLNRGLLGLGLPPFDIYSLGGMVWVLGLFLAPFVFLGTADALSRIDPTLEEAARMSGASRFQVLRDVTLPLALPAIGAGASFVVAFSAAAFGVPYLLAGGAAEPSWVLSTRIYQALALDPATGRPVAAALSLLLLLVGVGLPAIARRLEGRRSFVSVTGKANRGGRIVLGRWRWLAWGLLGSYALVAVVLPLVTIGLTSLMKGFGAGLHPDNLGFQHWTAVMLERPDTVQSLLRSGGLAASAATAATVIGGLVAWMAVRSPGRGSRSVAALARLPYAVPGTVLALGLLLVFSQEIRLVVLDRASFSLVLLDTVWLLGIAYTVKHLAFPVGTIQAALQGLDPALEEAARMSGASWGRSLLDVVLPLLLPSVVASWFLVAMPAFSEITMSVLLYGPRTPVVGTVLFHLQSYADPPAAAVLAVVLTAVVLMLSGGVRLLSRGRVGL